MPCFRWSIWFLSCLLIAALVLTVQIEQARACTGFLTGEAGRFVMGKSYDWDIEHGLVVFNPAGLEKSALNMDLEATPVKWTSKYASISFDQYGCEMPNGGMNSAGLAMELMILGQTQFPPPDDRPVLNELQFIQYALDSFASVAQMVEGAKAIRISKVHAPVHYLACDASGECAAFEWLEGELALSTGKDLPFPTLANSTYASSLEYLAQFEGFGGDQPIPENISSLARFARASALALSEASGPVPEAAFSILDSVSQGAFSKWNIVYDLEERTIHFRTLSSPAVKTVSLDDFQHHCSAGRFILDLGHPAAGDASGAFVPYTLEANKELIDKTLSTIPGLSPIILDILAAYPDSLICLPSEVPDQSEDVAAVEVDVVVDVSSGEAGDDIHAWEVMPGEPSEDTGVPVADGSDPQPEGKEDSGGCSAGSNGAGGLSAMLLAVLVLLGCGRIRNRRRGRHRPVTG